MTKGWSEERRKQQAARCWQNKPWEHSTGPKTAEGKKQSSLNAFQHGLYCRVWDEYRMILKISQAFLTKVDEVVEVDEEIKRLNKRRSNRRPDTN